ncbi:MAG: hypothetical protein CSYNP_02395 [Syntrophus sp. SKADARSKE-3]|nr:hypothetical protein [Syntrophus sp. SKADARSKE-3]
MYYPYNSIIPIITTVLSLFLQISRRTKSYKTNQTSLHCFLSEVLVAYFQPYTRAVYYR